MRHHARTTITAAAGLALSTTALLTSVLLAGCSDNDDSTTTAAAGQDRADLENAVRTYLGAFYTGDGDTVWSLVSDRCQQRHTRAQAEREMQYAQTTYGHLTVRSVSVDQLSGDLARISFDVGVPALARTGSPWVREDGHWHYDAC